MDPNKCSENLGTDGFRENSPYNLCRRWHRYVLLGWPGW